VIKINIRIDNSDNMVACNLDSAGASLADLGIAERMLRRYLERIVAISNEILDRDTDTRKPTNKRMGMDRDNRMDKTEGNDDVRGESIEE